jgi:uncharacterized membrane protein YhaH (DUF805 family)
MLYWIARPWRQALDFRGRATRREYWTFLPLLYALWIAGIATAAMVMTAADVDDDTFDLILITSTLVSMLVGFIPLLSASVRRLHDHDKTGWLFLLAFIPLVGWIFFLIMMLTPGSPGENGYGPDPRRRGFTGDDAYAVFS